MAEPSGEDLVIIGYAAETCLGDEYETFRRIMEGESSFTNLRQPGQILDGIPEEVTRAEVGGVLPEKFDPLAYEGYRDENSKILKDCYKRNRDRHRAVQIFTSLGVRALRHANLFLEEGGRPTLTLDPTKVPDTRQIGVFAGTGIGGGTVLPYISERIRIDRPTPPSVTLQMEPERIASVLSMEVGAHGPLATFSGACASGNMAPIFGEWALRLNKADFMVVGGAEGAIVPEIFAAFDGMDALDKEKDPAKASRPFDMSRGGFVPAEGGGAIVLTKRRIAEQIGSVIHAEFIGSGLAADGYSDTEPEPKGTYAAYAMEQAMDGVVEYLNGSEAEGYVATHGTATPLGDDAELRAMGKVETLDPEKTSVSSLKSMIGHIIGGSAAAELVVCTMVVSTYNQGVLVPPSVHIPNPDFDIIKSWRMNIGQAPEVPNLRWALNNSFGFGGYDYVDAVGAPR